MTHSDELKRMETSYDRVKDVYELAESRGLYVIESRPRYLMLDVDLGARVSLKEVHERIRSFSCTSSEVLGIWRLSDVITTQSQNGGAHIYIRLRDPLDDASRLVWQTALGSDPIKEVLSAWRLSQGIRPHSVMFETADERQRVIDFLGERMRD